MSERTPWWKAFLPKKKGGPDFDPFAQRPKDPAASAKTSGDQSLPHHESNNSSSLLSDETFDDSHLQSVFNEQTCRRNMRISRSGRFKEKKKVRSTLPLEEQERENVASGREDIR